MPRREINIALPGLPRGGVGHASSLVPLADGGYMKDNLCATRANKF